MLCFIAIFLFVTFFVLTNRTPLHYAAYGGFLNVVKLLVENNTTIDIQDHDGWNAFDYSLANSHLKVAHYLIENGA